MLFLADTAILHDWRFWGAALSALCIGLGKGGLAGIGAIPAILMAEVMPAKASVGVVLPLLIIGDCYAVRVYGRHCQWKYVRWLLPPIIVGVILGWLAMEAIPADDFRFAIGLVVLSLAALQIGRKMLGASFEKMAHSRLFSNAMGVMGGVSTMMANAAGPVMTIYFLSVSLLKMNFIGTVACLFIIVNVFKVPFSVSLGLINVDVLILVALLAPFVILGVILARLVVNYISQRVFEWTILILTIVAALRLIFG